MVAVELAFSCLGEAIAPETPCLADPRWPPKMRYGIRQRDCIGLQQAYSAAALSPCEQKRPRRTVFNRLISLRKSGAGEGIRTLDPNLGKVVFTGSHER
jgi:hypothetical protein